MDDSLDNRGCDDLAGTAPRRKSVQDDNFVFLERRVKLRLATLLLVCASQQDNQTELTM